MEYLNVAVLGAGNLGSQLARCLEEAGHSVSVVYSRNLAHAEALAGQLYEAEPTDDLDLQDAPATVYLACVADDALPELAEAIRLPEGAVLLHTAGAQAISALAGFEGPKGIFYPLQTFSKAKPIRMEGVPLCLEADSDEAEEALYILASSLSKEIYWMTHEQRLALHVAAVFASNFTNHMLTIAKHICDGEQLQFKMLRPLVRETIEKAMMMGPEQSQTGPAIRGDEATLATHLRYLGDNRELHQLYQLISQSIRLE